MQSDLTKEDLTSHLKNNKLSAEWLFQVHVIQRRSHLFSTLNDGIEKEGEFRREIAKSVGLGINAVNIVGSAQTGYSIKPNAKLREIDFNFRTTKNVRDRSDVDVSITSPEFFNTLKKELQHYTKNFKIEWTYNDYYPTDEKLEHFDIPRADYQFYRYLAQGWIRPDLCPNGFQFPYTPILNKWKKILDRKISIGIYQEWEFLKNYQALAFESLRNAAIKGEL